MAGVVDELKDKLAKLAARLEAIRTEAIALEAQRQAFETVIACYDPSFRPVDTPDRKRTSSEGQTTPTKRVTALLKGINPRHVVLDILRKSDAPVAAAEVAQRFVAHQHLGDTVDGLGSHITSRFVTILNGLHKQELVRFAMSEDGNNRRLWEINR